MKKRWLSILVWILTISCCGAFSSCRGGAPGESLQFQERLDEEGYTVIGIGTVSTVNIIIPHIYNFSPVVEIGGDAFREEMYLKSVTIPSTVTRIGDFAFSECSNLEKVNLGKGVQVIGMNAFANCSSLESITIPDSVISVGWNAFSGCSGIKTLVIEDGVSGIDPSAFGHCINISEASAPAFAWSYIPKVNLEKAVITSGEAIHDKAFSGATKLTSIDIPDSITMIGSLAFENCERLTNIKIPSGVVSIANDAFKGCSALTNISVAKNNPTYYSLDGNLYTKEDNVLMCYVGGKEETSFTIPDGVTKIGDAAFSDCDNLTSVSIPNSVTMIGASVFSDCDNLTSVILPNGMIRVGWSAYRYCDNLKNVELPDTVTTLDYWCFSDCTSLTSVVIGDGMEAIGWGAFKGCENLTAVYYKGSPSEWDEIAINHYNEALIEAMRYYYDESETANCWWHYDENGVIVHA